jgi:hypothetical protein
MKTWHLKMANFLMVKDSLQIAARIFNESVLQRSDKQALNQVESHKGR